MQIIQLPICAKGHLKYVDWSSPLYLVYFFSPTHSLNLFLGSSQLAGKELNTIPSKQQMINKVLNIHQRTTAPVQYIRKKH